MGTKSKPPVEIQPGGCGTEVPHQDGLPRFQRFVDIHGLKRGQKSITRLFLAAATNEDVDC